MKSPGMGLDAQPFHIAAARLECVRNFPAYGASPACRSSVITSGDLDEMISLKAILGCRVSDVIGGGIAQPVLRPCRLLDIKWFLSSLLARGLAAIGRAGVTFAAAADEYLYHSGCQPSAGRVIGCKPKPRKSHMVAA